MIDRLLTPLRAVVRDLVDKRLWPIAIVLVAALVAVPAVIGASGDAPPPVAAVPSATPAAGAAVKSAITVAEPAVVGHSRPGAVNDPFYDPPKPKAPAASSSSSGATRAATTSQSSTPAAATSPSPSTTTAAPTTQTQTQTPTPAPATAPAATVAERAVFRTHVRWGRDEHADVRGLSRLQPLGGAANPALVYLGTTAHGARAVFVLGPAAESDGDGVCAERTCRVIALKPGETRTVQVLDAAGDTHRFTLVVEDITRRVMATRSAALERRARLHPFGRDVLGEISQDARTATALGKFAVDRATGAVVASSAP